jgi:hypothetical protein
MFGPKTVPGILLTVWIILCRKMELSIREKMLRRDLQKSDKRLDAGLIA